MRKSVERFVISETGKEEGEAWGGGAPNLDLTRQRSSIAQRKKTGQSISNSGGANRVNYLIHGIFHHQHERGGNYLSGGGGQDAVNY